MFETSHSEPFPPLVLELVGGATHRLRGPMLGCSMRAARLALSAIPATVVVDVPRSAAGSRGTPLMTRLEGDPRGRPQDNQQRSDRDP